MDAYQGKVKDKHVIHRHRPHTHSEGIASQESVLDSFGELSVSFVTHSLLLLKMFLPRPVKKANKVRLGKYFRGVSFDDVQGSDIQLQ